MCPAYAEEDAINVEESTIDINLGEDKQGSRTGNWQTNSNKHSISVLIDVDTDLLNFWINLKLFRFSLFATDANTVKREEEAIRVDELNVAQIKELRDKVW